MQICSAAASLFENGDAQMKDCGRPGKFIHLLLFLCGVGNVAQEFNKADACREEQEP